MKTSLLPTLLAALVISAPAMAQNASPPAKQVQPTARDTNVVNDGLVFYRGQTFLIRNARAAAVDASLVAEGEILTPEGKRVPLPKDIGINPKPEVTDGIFMVNGDTYLLRNGNVTRVDATLIPEGRVLTADNRLMPLPSDFSGFVLDRAPDGTILPTPPAQAGPQALSGQAGVPQVPSATQPQNNGQQNARPEQGGTGTDDKKAPPSNGGTTQSNASGAVNTRPSSSR
jgi:hypothetical protein